jgi:hypothetical protein
MRRREFMTLVGGAAAWPLAGRSQQPSTPVVGLVGAEIFSNHVSMVTGPAQSAARIAGRKMPSKTSARGALSRRGDWRHFALQPVAHSYPPAAPFKAARLIF